MPSKVIPLNKVDPDSLNFLISDSARLIRMLFEKRISEAGLGLTPGEARTLLHVSAINGSRQLELAARMGVEAMTVCSFLDKLQSLDLIDRKPDPSDRRAKRIELTEKSAQVIEIIRGELLAVLDKATDGMDDDKKDILKQTMQQFRSNLQKADVPDSSA